MVDPAIQVGDIVHDLIERGHMRVLEHEGTVAEYRDRSDDDFDHTTYKTHPLIGVTDDEDVYRCVYLSSDPSVGYKQSYAFPESRLARAPVEEASKDLERPYHSIRRALLASLFANAEDEEELNTIYETAYRAGLYPDLVDEARELAEAATITAEPDGGEE